jgi:DNA polymerase I-like protein with 3'-5' exonuclease and polymerase domains
MDPQLQHLSKKYRQIIIPRPDHNLIYLDFSQFEPSIMASISKNSQLASHCSRHDLYTILAEEIFGDSEQREAAKLVFLAYSYGKTADSLADLVSTQTSVVEDKQMVGLRLLPWFEDIEQWKTTIEHKLLHVGRIGTAQGNHRYRNHDGDLRPEERRWAISQIIQGTGSLILKKAILKVVNRVPDVFILLPMHDALLLDVPKGKKDILVGQLVEICSDAFSEVCTGVTPAVRLKPFCD